MLNIFYIYYVKKIKIMEYGLDLYLEKLTVNLKRI